MELTENSKHFIGRIFFSHENFKLKIFNEYNDSKADKTKIPALKCNDIIYYVLFILKKQCYDKIYYFFLKNLKNP
jgi:hypothetical protein